ncbi:hypothetical protein [Tatumella ptyseos]|uniref:Uncharacterized protein n=1 Tax=Tatumella ptyseos TaxID=82987 RepID=A0A2X5P257_9GAMM|nr:hypothetical protein [Tatumella ptyseos]SQK72413.1 Uncharacterised protein [Tatumella ptyseos]
MELKVEGITEEEYGLWLNGFPQSTIPPMDEAEYQVIHMGFDLERAKNFSIRPISEDIRCSLRSVMIRNMILIGSI